MTSFGEKLKYYITENGYTIYRLAKYAQVERTSIHRAITGQRILSRQSLIKIMDCLELTAPEQEELWEAYEIQRVGPGAFKERRILSHLIESLTLACEAQPAAFAIHKDVQILEQTQQGPLMLHGKYNVINNIRPLLEQAVYCSSPPPS